MGCLQRPHVKLMPEKENAKSRTKTSKWRRWLKFRLPVGFKLKIPYWFCGTYNHRVKAPIFQSKARSKVHHVAALRHEISQVFLSAAINVKIINVSNCFFFPVVFFPDDFNVNPVNSSRLTQVMQRHEISPSFPLLL